MTDEPFDRDSDIDAPTSVVPRAMERTPPRSSGFAFVRPQANKKPKVAKAKAAPQARNPMTTYAQVVRWSFCLTVILIGLLAALIYASTSSGQPPFYAFAVLAGALGAFMSSLIRIYKDAQFSKFLNSPDFPGLKKWDLTVYALVPPVVGIISASILFVIFAAGILQGGALFPIFACELGDGKCGTFENFIYDFGPRDATDYARTLIWCFAAGIAERLVPDKLKGLAAGAETAKPAK